MTAESPPHITVWPSIGGTFAFPLKEAELPDGTHVVRARFDLGHGVTLCFRCTEDVYDWLAHVRQQLTTAVIDYTNTPLVPQ